MASKQRDKARRRNNKPADVWHHRASPLRLGDDRLRFTNVQTGEDLGGLLTTVTWDDVSMELTGSVQAQLPLKKVRLDDGTKIRCDYSPSVNAAFKLLWTLEVGGGEDLTRGMAADDLSGGLASTLTRFRGHRMDFHYRRDKHHPKGWTCDQIARDVAKKVGLPLGKIAKGTHRIRNLVRRDADPMDVILVAYRQEREANGRRYFASWNGRLSITVLTRSKDLVDLLPVLMDGTYTTTRRSDFATVLNVRATAKHGKRRSRKIRVRVVDHDAVKQHGVVSKTVSPKGIDSEAEARDWARASLKRRTSRKRTLEVTVPLMPRLKRGDALTVHWRDLGLNQVVFVRSASHEWTPGGGQTTIQVRFDDPFVNKRSTKTAKAKAAKAKKRHKPTPASATRQHASAPSPKNAGRRGNK